MQTPLRVGAGRKMLRLVQPRAVTAMPDCNRCTPPNARSGGLVAAECPAFLRDSGSPLLSARKFVPNRTFCCEIA